MKRFPPVTLLILSILLLAVSCRNEQTTSAPAAKENLSGDEYPKKAPAEWDKFFNSRDAANLSDLYAEDAVSMPYNYQTVNGKKAIRAEFEKFFEQNEATKHETFPEEIITKDDVSIERSRYINTYTPKGTNNRIVETGRHVMCRKKLGGKWLIAWEIWNSDQPPPK